MPTKISYLRNSGQGILRSGGGSWTLAHHAWLRRRSFPLPGLQAAFRHRV